MDSVDNLYKHILQAFDNAEKGISKIPHDILNMEGMTGKKTRHFYNNLLNSENIRYLEIGTWKGSSVCSAMCKNKATVVCIDDFSQFDGPRTEFLENFNRFKGENDAIFIEEDCFTVDISQLPKFNIYLFDAEHSKESHFKALCHYYDCLDDIFVFIVDDWNWSDVRDGTYKSFEKLNLTILREKDIRTSWDNRHSVFGSPEQIDWHNGIYVAILTKNKQVT